MHYGVINCFFKKKIMNLVEAFLNVNHFILFSTLVYFKIVRKLVQAGCLDIRRTQKTVDLIQNCRMIQIKQINKVK